MQNSITRIIHIPTLWQTSHKEVEGSLRGHTPLSTALTQDSFSTCEGKPTQRCTIEWEKERNCLQNFDS